MLGQKGAMVVGSSYQNGTSWGPAENSFNTDANVNESNIDSVFSQARAVMEAVVETLELDATIPLVFKDDLQEIDERMERMQSIGTRPPVIEQQGAGEAAPADPGSYGTRPIIVPNPGG